jgi:hypothetical protein
MVQMSSFADTPISPDNHIKSFMTETISEVQTGSYSSSNVNPAGNDQTTHMTGAGVCPHPLRVWFQRVRVRCSKFSPAVYS